MKVEKMPAQNRHWNPRTAPQTVRKAISQLIALSAPSFSNSRLAVVSRAFDCTGFVSMRDTINAPIMALTA